MLAITVATGRHGSIMGALTNPRQTPAAERNRDFARRELAKLIADNLIVSRHEVTRPMGDSDTEATLTRLREQAAQRRLFADQ